ncbi:MAG: DUF5694 domain-containing protein [Bacteroidota bacterium]
MKKVLIVLLAATSLSTAKAQEDKIEILLLGTLHFIQFHNAESENRNFLGERRQNEIQSFSGALGAFSPDMIMIERSPEQQLQIDSLYRLFKADQLDILNKTYLREAYQLGFRLANSHKLGKVYGVDYYESTSQGLLASGDNIDRFQAARNEFGKLGGSVNKRFVSGEMTIADLFLTLNKPENVALTHRLLFNTPAYIKNGAFKSYDGLSEIDTTYIGAEFISLFYERNLKIYSNILNTQLADQGNRIILIIGQTHVGVLKSLLEHNPNYKVVELADVVKR